MTEKQTTAKAKDASPLDWMNMLTEFWSPIINTMGTGLQSLQPTKPPKPKGRLDEGLQSTVNLWQAMFKTMASPGAIDTFQTATQTTPDMLLGFTQTFMQSFMAFQSQVVEWMAKTGQSVTPHDFQEIDRDLLHQWTDMYQKEFSQYFNIPQIGLGRFYQEKTLQAIDKSNLFQAAVAEFIHVLYLPMEKSFKILQQKISDMADEGELDENPKVYYKLWIQVLEGCYMELFKQPEFPDALSKTLEAMNAFFSARQEVINDLLKSLAVPTQEDLDELYKEIHLLKRRLRNNEKKGT